MRSEVYHKAIAKAVRIISYGLLGETNLVHYDHAPELWKEHSGRNDQRSIKVPLQGDFQGSSTGKTRREHNFVDLRLRLYSRRDGFEKL